MERTSLDLLKVGVERGYLDRPTAERILREAEQRRCSPERILLERRMLSLRRIERLRGHVQYRSVRRTDKRYVTLAVQLGWIGIAEAKAALTTQREVFESQRECVRVGAQLIDGGLLTVAQDRVLRAKLSGKPVEAVPVALPQVRGASSAATLALHASSQIGVAASASGGSSSYRALEAAIDRVEAIRAVADDLSTSDQVASPDSAAEYENACRMLARRRVARGNAPALTPPAPPPAPAPTSKRKKKSTGGFRTLFGKVA